jgi:integrator complex subunit 11
LPFFTERCGYDGPILMTYPTKAIAPILLEDFRKVVVEVQGKDEKDLFSSQDVKNCMKKVTALNLHQTIVIDGELEIRPYYAGHVLGAALFYVKDLVTGLSVVYTGDYNMTPDRHLGRASIDRLRPDLFITETTYATTIRDSKNSREREFLQTIHQTIEKGGKVLIPVFALGRAQELCILLETYWERMNIKCPIYFSAGLVEKANYYYKLFINWTNEKIKKTFVERNMFDFKHIQPFDRSMVDNPGPCVLFATPGMLHAGMSMEVFKKWGISEKNTVILPGYCVAGTFGNKLLKKKKGKMEVDKNTVIDVKCHVVKISFSAHADAKGILDLINQCQPKNIMMVHGEKGKMKILKTVIEKDLKIQCYDPPNGHTITIHEDLEINIKLSTNLLKRTLTTFENNKKPKIEGILVTKENEIPYLIDAFEGSKELGLQKHSLEFKFEREIPLNLNVNLHEILTMEILNKYKTVIEKNGVLEYKSVKLMNENNKIVLLWNFEDDEIGESISVVVDEVISKILLNSK